MAEAKVNVSFACQRCLQPIQMEDSFHHINIHDSAELNLPIHVISEIDLDSQANSVDHLVPPFTIPDAGAVSNDFTLISDIEENHILSTNLYKKAKLFDNLSSNSVIDHPLCDECADSLYELMDAQLKSAEDEWNDYNNYLQKLDKNCEVPNIDSLQNELSQLAAEEEKLMLELRQLQEKEATLKETMKEKTEEKKRLDYEEEKFRREYAKQLRETSMLKDEEQSIENQKQYAEKQLDLLSKTNVFNVTFHIWHSGHFGTINNFRLGRLPSEPVDWPEINAAWGQTALLLSCLAKFRNLEFKNYKLVPYGNHSFIKDLKTGVELPLHVNGGMKFVWDTKFDAAMVAFVDCMLQYNDDVAKEDVGFRLPYCMEKGKIIDVNAKSSFSVKIQFNSEEQWTKALKFLLTNLKWCLAWASARVIETKSESS